MYKTWQEAEAAFDDLLDCEGAIEIMGISYDRSRILREVDPIAYRTWLIEYIDSEGTFGEGGLNL